MNQIFKSNKACGTRFGAILQNVPIYSGDKKLGYFFMIFKRQDKEVVPLVLSDTHVPIATISEILP